MENTEKLPIKSVDSTVFNCFNNLTSSNENDRVNAGIQLLQHLSKNRKKEKSDKELQYMVKRLVRGVGASTNASRAGFFTTLVGFLKTFSPSYVDVKTILAIAKKQLHVRGAVSKKEDADAVVGHILVCGALHRSQKLLGSSTEILSEVIDMLITSSKYRSYHSSMAYTFLSEILLDVNEDDFKSVIWQKLENELKKPWDRQTMNTVNCLILITNRFPNIATKKYLKEHFGGTQLLNPHSFKYFLNIFWNNTSINMLGHTGFENFAKYIANCKYLESFWNGEVNDCLSSPIKLREIQTLRILTVIFENADHNFSASKLLSKNFIKMMVVSLKNMKIKKDETLKAFYDDFFEVLGTFCGKVESDTEKVEIIYKLILYPGILNIEKYTRHRIVHQIIAHLGEEGIQKLFETYKQIFLNKLCKNPENSEDTWLNVERQNAGYLLNTLISHKNVQTSFDWRAEQLKFMMTLALFNVHKGEIVKQNENIDDLTEDFIIQIKNIFYNSLQSKLARLKDEKNVLVTLMKACNDVLQRQHYNKYLRNRIDKKIINVWNDMYAEVTKMKKGTADDILQSVFHILLSHMGFQLFREPEMAEVAILDLEKCMEKAKNKSRKTNDHKEGDAEQEPEWIDVVIDLFLHLLSQNNSALRNVVNTVFPHLCNNITLTAMHQILSVLDMRDSSNPLSESNEIEDNQSDEEDETLIDLNKNSDESSDDNEDDSDDDEEEIIEEEEDRTNKDKLRNAISTALGNFAQDADQESINLDDMDEDEGNKLDQALAEAFKLIKGQKEHKRSKSYRVKMTTVMHFRIRVLDLIDIYIQHNPSLLMCLEIMMSLYNMIEFCGDGELKPLSIKVEKALLKLTTLRNFCNVDDVTEQNICDFFCMIVEKKVKAPLFEVLNKVRDKCAVFLIACVRLLESTKQNTESTGKMHSILSDYINDFIKLRNPVINSTILCDIFKMRWQGVWKLAKTLVQNGLDHNTRVFRRIQIIEILNLLYKNYELIKHDITISKKYLKKIENYFQKHIESLVQKDKISVKEFNTILDVLFSARKCHTKISIKSYLNEESICENIQNIRNKIKLENYHSYNRFCNVFGVTIIKNSEVSKPNVNVLENGTHEILSEDLEGSDSLRNAIDKNGIQQLTNSQKKLEKRKQENNIIKDARKHKKIKKEIRLKKASEGLNGGLSFVSGSTDTYMPIKVNDEYLEMSN